MVIRAMVQNVNLSIIRGVLETGAYESFGTSDSLSLHAFLMTIPDDKRAIIYKKKVVDKLTGTWSWCYYLLGDCTPSKIETKARKPQRYAENGFGNRITFEKYLKFTDSQINSAFTVLMSDSLWCSELDTGASTFTYDPYSVWMNTGTPTCRSGNGSGFSNNVSCGNIKTDKALSTNIDAATPFFGMPLEQMRQWDTVHNAYAIPNFYNGSYHNYCKDYICTVMARIQGNQVMDIDMTNSMLLYDINNPLKKTELGNLFSPYGYKKNESDTTKLYATYLDYIDWLINNKGEMLPRKTISAENLNHARYLDTTNYGWVANDDDTPNCGLIGEWVNTSQTELFIPCGNWYFDNVYVSSDYDACKEYVDTGKIPSDAYIHRINPDGTTDDTPNDNDNPSNDNTDGSKRENQAENNPTVGGITCGAVNYYYMPEQQVKAFFDWFWNNTPALEDVINNYVTGIYNNLSEMITGLYYFPCSTDFLCASIGTGTIQIGRYSSGISATTITSLPKNQELAIIKIEPYFNSFLDYEGYTKIQLYLPYFGIVDLPTNTVMGTTITVLCAVDITSCTMSYIVKSGGAIVFETSVPFGLNLPISLSSSMEKATNTLNSVIGLGSSIATTAMIAKAEPVLGALSLANTVSSFHAPVPDITVKGNTTSFSGQWQPQRCALIIQRPITAVPTNYGSKIGFCLNKAYKLDTLTGFTRCENAQITFSEKTPLKSEQEEIYNLLEKGVIL